MSNYIKKLGLTGMAILAGGIYTGGNLNQVNLESYNKKYEVYEKSRLEEMVKEQREKIFNLRAEEQSSDEIKTPKYSIEKVPDNYCSRYANRSAKKIFKKEYEEDDAWDLKYKNSIIDKFKDDEIISDSTIYESIKNKIIDGTLKPGMMVVTKRDLGPKEYLKYTSYPKKGYKYAGKDEKGNKIEDTHVILYIGINKNKEPEFIHKWVDKTERITIDDFKERKNLKPTYILDEPGKIELKAEIEKDNPLNISKAEAQHKAGFEDTKSKYWADLATKNLKEMTPVEN